LTSNGAEKSEVVKLLLMQLLDGKATAAKVRESVAAQAQELRARGVVPGLGTILVGDDPASATYIGAKIRACEEAGINSVHEHLPADTDQSTLNAVIDRFNSDPAVHAYIVQLPLPKHLNEEEALLRVAPDKDADGLHPVNLGRLVMGAQGPVPCTPAGIVELLVEHGVPIEGRHVVIVGRGLTIGRPLALLLALKRPHCNAAVTVVHTGVKNLADYTRQADIVVAAAGAPGLVTKEMIKSGAAVVGGGISREGNRIISDLDENVAEVAGWVTPRVGGVGPMTVAMLLKNTVLAAQKTLA
jgi:methylenetetrahydrofolate dehydrogenase (NADP+)/methenyltetrahydrofolate cyclohydrolase